MRKIIACLSAVVIFVVTAVFADTGWTPAYIGSAGHTGQFDESGFYVYEGIIEHPTVAMLEENVDIYLHAAETTVYAEFLFENDGPATTVDMFYPLVWGWRSSVAMDFAVYEKRAGGALKAIPFAEEAPSEEAGPTIARWDMPFAAGETKVIVCFYNAGYGGEAGLGFVRWQMDGYDLWEEIVRKADTPPDYLKYDWQKENWAKEPKERVYVHVLQENTFGYTVTTGAGWKGPIGKGRIAFHTTDEVSWEDLVDYEGELFGGSFFDDYSDLEYIEQNGIGISLESDALVFSFEDFEPTREIFARYWIMRVGIERVGVVGEAASSTLPGEKEYSYDVEHITGFRPTDLFSELLGGFHAWSEGVAGDGVGEWIEFDILPSKLAEVHGKPFAIKGVRFYGGFHSNLDDFSTDLFEKNGAPSAVTVAVYDDGSRVLERRFDLVELSKTQEDSPNIGSVYLPFGEPIECDEMKITIDHVRPGTEWSDTCISGVVPVVHDPRTHHNASSSLVESPGDICRFHPIKIDDGDPATCWVEGVLGPGVGEWVEMSWEIPRDVSGFTILPGFARDEGTWQANGRPAEVKVELYRQDECVYEESFALEDVMTERTFDFALGTFEGVDRCRFFIEGVYRGDKYDDTCISEIRLR